MDRMGLASILSIIHTATSFTMLKNNSGHNTQELKKTLQTLSLHQFAQKMLNVWELQKWVLYLKLRSIWLPLLFNQQIFSSKDWSDKWIFTTLC